MYDGLVRNVVPLLLRLTLAAIFLVHGWNKIFGPGNEAGLMWARELAEPPSRGVQLLLAWGELALGAMMLIGFATRVAAACVIIAIAAEIYFTHNLHGWSVTNYGLEYQFALVMISVCLFITGGGRFCLAPQTYWPRRRPAPIPPALPVETVSPPLPPQERIG